MKLYTVPEAAQVLRISKAHAYQLVKSGELPTLKLGRLKVTETALQEFVEKLQAEGPQQ